jgi:N-acetylglucosaminyl-diphospho-decaprenol L-rhamnosyltransferase
MFVAVAIVGFRNADDVVRCVAALARSTHPDFEIVVCENGGAEAHAALASRLPAALSGGQPVRILKAPRNLGYAGGVNACLAAAEDADAWWVLNPDTEPAPLTMERLVARLSAGDSDAVGCTVHFPDGLVQSHGGRWQGGLARASSIGYGSRVEDPVDPREIERAQNYLNGASMFVGRRFLREVGPMREDYFLYCEEVEWCLRARKLGMRLGYAADAPVLHYQGTTMGNFWQFRRRARLSVHLNERNRILLTKDHYPALVLGVGVSAFALFLYRYGRRMAWRQYLYALGGWWAGVRGERGAPRWAPS